jgi:tetratricopeptide (TPR) repeat protein
LCGGLMDYRAVMLNYFHQRDRGFILLLFAAVCLVYLPFLGSPFVFDDLSFFTRGEPERYAYSFFKFDLRWLPYASLGWTYAIFSDVDTHFYHLGNMLLHFSNVILLFYLLRQLAGALISEHEKSSALIGGAWLGALVFACHPVAVYAVGYVIERSILMATLFALVMQLAYVKGMLSGQSRWLLLAVAAYFLAGFSKEHSVMMPAVLAAQTILLRGKNQLEWRALALTWFAFISIGLLLVLSSRGVIGTAYEPMAAIIFNQQGALASTPMLHLLSALTQAGLFFKYLFLWLLPNPAWMSVDMREHFITSLSEWQGWAGGLAFMAYGVTAFRLLLRPRWLGLLGLALLYPWLQFMVELVAIRVQEPFVLYRSYLWLPGLMLFFPWLLIKFPKRRAMLALLIVVLLIPLAWNRLWMFADDFRLWNDAVVKLPSELVVGADRDFYNRAQSLAAKRKWAEAAADFEQAVRLSPKFPQLHKELAIAYANQGRYREAIIQLDVAIALEPRFAAAYYYKGLALKALHDNELAMQQMVKSCELQYAMACVIVKFAPPKK